MNTTAPTIRLHHATAKKAAALGLTITDADNGCWEIQDGDDRYQHEDPKVLLQAYCVGLLGHEDEEALDIDELKVEDAEPEEDEDEEDENENEDGEKSRSIVKPKYRQAYKPHRHTNGDDMAAAFKDYTAITSTAKPTKKYPLGRTIYKMDYAKLLEVATANGIDVRARWAHLNPGQQRMNLGNVLRGVFRNGTPVIVGDQVFEAPKAE